MALSVKSITPSQLRSSQGRGAPTQSSGVTHSSPLLSRNLAGIARQKAPLTNKPTSQFTHTFILASTVKKCSPVAGRHESGNTFGQAGSSSGHGNAGQALKSSQQFGSHIGFPQLSLTTKVHTTSDSGHTSKHGSYLTLSQNGRPGGHGVTPGQQCSKWA